MRNYSWYNVKSGVRGFDSDWGSYMEFPTEDEYIELQREEEEYNADDNR